MVSGDSLEVSCWTQDQTRAGWHGFQSHLGQLIFIKKLSLIFSVNTRCHYLMEPDVFIPLYHSVFSDEARCGINIIHPAPKHLHLTAKIVYIIYVLSKFIMYFFSFELKLTRIKTLNQLLVRVYGFDPIPWGLDNYICDKVWMYEEIMTNDDNLESNLLTSILLKMCSLYKLNWRSVTV